MLNYLPITYFRVGEVPSTWSVTRQIINESGFGLNGLNRGLTATIGRNGVFNMIYFGFYHSVKGFLPEYKVIRKHTCARLSRRDTKFIISAYFHWNGWYHFSACTK